MTCQLLTSWTGDPDETADLVRFALQRFHENWWSSFEDHRTLIGNGEVTRTFKRRIHIMTDVSQSERLMIDMILAGHVISWYDF